MDEPTPWIAFGVDLRLSTTEEGGRTKPLGIVPYERFHYRPNWGLPGMSFPGQAGAPVLCFGRTPLHPGDETRAVIVPLVELALPLWEKVAAGDTLTLYEGARVCGYATVVWLNPTERPVPPDDGAVFTAWAEGGDAPPTR